MAGGSERTCPWPLSQSVRLQKAVLSPLSTDSPACTSSQPHPTASIPQTPRVFVQALALVWKALPMLPTMKGSLILQDCAHMLLFSKASRSAPHTQGRATTPSPCPQFRAWYHKPTTFTGGSGSSDTVPSAPSTVTCLPHGRSTVSVL